MNPKQKSFLDDLGAVFSQYNITHVHVDGGAVIIMSGATQFRFRYYHTNNNGERIFVGVTTTSDYKADPHSAIEYSGEENFDD